MKPNSRNEFSERGTLDERLKPPIWLSNRLIFYLLSRALFVISILAVLHTCAPVSTLVRDPLNSTTSSGSILLVLEATLGNMRLFAQGVLLALFTLTKHVIGTNEDPQDSFEFDCAALPYRLNESILPNTTIFFSQYVAGGSNISLSHVNATCSSMGGGLPSQVVPIDICRVAAHTATSDRSGIHYEVWLPRSWTGRFMSHGNGGLSGCISI